MAENSHQQGITTKETAYVSGSTAITRKTISIKRTKGNKKMIEVKEDFKKVLGQHKEVNNVIVVATGGEANIGKSFLMNLIKDYLSFRAGEQWQEKQWITEHKDRVIEGFPLRSDQDNCGTEYIQIWNDSFVIQKEPGSTEKMMVILMDCQGFGDSDLPEELFITKHGIWLSTHFLYSIDDKTLRPELSCLEKSCEQLKESLENGEKQRFLRMVRWVLKEPKEELFSLGDFEEVFNNKNDQIPVSQLMTLGKAWSKTTLGEIAKDHGYFIESVYTLCREIFETEQCKDYMATKAQLEKRLESSDEIEMKREFTPADRVRFGDDKLQKYFDELLKEGQERISTYNLEGKKKSTAETDLQVIIDLVLKRFNRQEGVKEQKEPYNGELERALKQCKAEKLGEYSKNAVKKKLGKVVKKAGNLFGSADN